MLRCSICVASAFSDDHTQTIQRRDFLSIRTGSEIP